MRRLLMLLGVSGVLVAGLLDSFWYLYNGGKLGPPSPAFARSFENITLAVWPSSIMMMATEGATTRLLVTAVSISLLLNGLFYMAIGYIAVKLFRFIS